MVDNEQLNEQTEKQVLGRSPKKNQPKQTLSTAHSAKTDLIMWCQKQGIEGI